MCREYSLLLLFLALCSGCQKKTSSFKKQQPKQRAYDVYVEQEAKQQGLYNASHLVCHQKEIDVDDINVDYVWSVDVPIPLHAVEKRNYYQAQQDLYSIGYTVGLERDHLVDFYKKQMELFGWHCWWETDGLESLLLFEKPHKHCAVSIRQSNVRKKQDIVVLQKTV